MVADQACVCTLSLGEERHKTFLGGTLSTNIPVDGKCVLEADV